jgi:hypothetical protein
VASAVGKGFTQQLQLLEHIVCNVTCLPRGQFRPIGSFHLLLLVLESCDKYLIFIFFFIYFPRSFRVSKASIEPRCVARVPCRWATKILHSCWFLYSLFLCGLAGYISISNVDGDNPYPSSPYQLAIRFSVAYAAK